MFNALNGVSRSGIRVFVSMVSEAVKQPAFCRNTHNVYSTTSDDSS